ncbi:hypothetical protein GIB67_002461 [Kingdonia uniflora]|uniref:Protein CHUP1, chloroplastic n=1 Tax=Kingdonia uniflora TaxID=39325 RepID=A0A7J7LAG0_9MAGN|nr:hypothetical protein GIB67_002461 [Kingdonia uniflora]
MLRNNRVRPVLIGVAMTISVAGLVYSHIRSKRITSPRPSPTSPTTPSGGRKFCLREKLGFVIGLRGGAETTLSPGSPASREPKKIDEDTYDKVATDNFKHDFSLHTRHSSLEGFFLREFNDSKPKDYELLNTINLLSPRKNVENAPPYKIVTEEETDQEIIKLRNMVKVLREREKNLEIQLLECYGLNEKEAVVTELQNQLKVQNVEAKLYTVKIESLQADNQRMEAEVSDYWKVLVDLESAKSKIKALKKKMRYDAEENKELLYDLQQRDANLRELENRVALTNADIEKKQQKLKEMEEESDKLRRDNSRLQCENLELVRKLESAHNVTSSALAAPEVEALQDTIRRLREENTDLSNEIEQLQANRCADVEELVYLRWVNACLRHEQKHYQAPPGKTLARDLSKNSSPRSEEKVKKLILDHAKSEGTNYKQDSFNLMDIDFEYWSSSQTSHFTDSTELDDSSGDISSSTRSNSSRRPKIFTKLKDMLHKKHHQHRHHHEYSNRISTSSSESSMSLSSCVALSSEHNSSISAKPLSEIEARIDERMSKINSLSWDFSRLSTDIRRARSLISLQDVPENDMSQRVTASSHRDQKMLTREGSFEIPKQEQTSPEKLKLIKFAEVLKDSHGTLTPRRSFEGFSWKDKSGVTR